MKKRYIKKLKERIEQGFVDQYKAIGIVAQSHYDNPKMMQWVGGFSEGLGAANKEMQAIVKELEKKNKCTAKPSI